MHWIHVVGFHFITPLFQIPLYYYKGLKYNDYSNYRPVQVTILTMTGFSQIWLCNFDTGWVLCPFPDSFQITKRHSYDGCSIHMPSFNQFFQWGVTDLRLFLCAKIGHNSVDLQVWRCALMSPLCVSSFRISWCNLLQIWYGAHLQRIWLNLDKRTHSYLITYMLTCARSPAIP